MSVATRRRMFWAAGLLLAVNVAVYLAYTLPRSLRKRNVASRVQGLEVELAQERTRAAELRARSEAITANRTDARAFLEGRVTPPGASLVPILEEIEALARKEGLKVGTQAFDQAAVKGLPIEQFKIVMPVSGRYDQVVGLVKQLERSTHFLTLDQIGAQRQGGVEEGGVVELNLVFSAYFRAEAPPR